jgi:dihydroorotate dehydrogenase (NAD+) catalytic subunit
MNTPRQGLDLSSPYMNAAGFSGFAPAPGWNWPDPMGVFITNPISRHSRIPAEERGLYPFSGGVLLHSGLPNPGIRETLHRYNQRWARSPIPIWVHLIGDNAADINWMVRGLEGREGIYGIELGLPPDSDGKEKLKLVKAALGELPLIVHIPIDTTGEEWLQELPGLGASAISIGAPRGTLANSHNRLVNGRIIGPGLLPQAARAVLRASRIQIPIIAGGGVYSKRDASLLFAAGASAIQLDGVLWK